MKCEEAYTARYQKMPEALAFCPYRICPLGAHIDHQFGRINGMAIDKGIHFAYSMKTSGICEVWSLNFQGRRTQFHVNAVSEVKQGDWADHLRGAALLLNNRYPLRFGVAGVLEGDLPIGGLSSSASVIIVFLTALCRVNGISLGEWELIMLAKDVENQYVGVNCGKLDQSCEVLSKKGQLLYLDTADDSFELIPAPAIMPDYRIAVFFSGLERSLVNSSYNTRVDECKAAAYALKAYADIPYGRYEETRLRDVPPEVYREYGERLPLNWRKRAEHFYTELARAEAGAEAWRRGDLKTYGQLMFESGRSSVINYESGSPELIFLYELMCETDGIYGGRFSGAGFKGCCVALIDPSCAVSVEEKVTEAYLKRFPALSDRYSFHLCDSADGVRLS